MSSIHRLIGLYIFLQIIGCNSFDPRTDIEGQWGTRSVVHNNIEMLSEGNGEINVITGRRLSIEKDGTVLLPVLNNLEYAKCAINKEEKEIKIFDSDYSYFNKTFKFEMGIVQSKSIGKSETYFLQLLSQDSLTSVYAERIISSKKMY